MSNANADNDSTAPDEKTTDDQSTKSPDSLPSGAGPQADGEQSDISSGGGTDS